MRLVSFLNTHHPSSLYEAFEPAEARRIAERLEIHYTPKHGSWPAEGCAGIRAVRKDKTSLLVIAFELVWHFRWNGRPSGMPRPDGYLLFGGCVG